MKKRIFLVLITFFLTLNNVEAYSNRYFDAVLPKEYKLTIEQDGVYQWVNIASESNYVVSVKMRTSDVDILDYNSNLKEKYIAGVVAEHEKQYNSLYNRLIPIELVYSDITQINNYEALLIKVKIKNFLDTKIEMNQYIYVLESKNYIYNIVYSTPNNKFDDKILNNFKNSFVINDKLDDKGGFVIIEIGAIIFASLLGGYFLGLNRKKKLTLIVKRKKMSK